MTLDEATITDLLKELDKRCPAVVVALLRPDDDSKCDTITFMSGNRAACLGLAHVVVSRCEVRLSMRPDPDDEDPD